MVKASQPGEKQASDRVWKKDASRVGKFGGARFHLSSVLIAWVACGTWWVRRAEDWVAGWRIAGCRYPYKVIIPSGAVLRLCGQCVCYIRFGGKKSLRVTYGDDIVSIIGKVPRAEIWWKVWEAQGGKGALHIFKGCVDDLRLPMNGS